MSRPIDVLHLGRDRVICAYEVGGVIVDPGPSSSVETLIDRLGPVEPRALLLTHIHLDHAGATGVLCRRYPNLKVYVHELGAPHLVDPSKLLKSAGRLYGDDMWELWGEVAPVPEERITALTGGETVEGFRVAYTPGHASHHVSYLHEESGDAYVGDVAGVRIPPYAHTIAPTPPPDINVETWLDSLHTIACWNPQTLGLTHFGQVTEVVDHLHRIRSALVESADSARLDGEERFIAKLEEGLGDATDLATVECFEQAAPPNQLYMGLERYWRKKAGVSQTVELPRVGGPGSGLDDNWRVIVLNDNHNTFEGVAFALSSTLPGVSYDAGMSMANEIHSKGQSIVWTGAREPAEHYWEQLKEAGLTMAPLEQG